MRSNLPNIDPKWPNIVPQSTISFWSLKHGKTIAQVQDCAKLWHLWAVPLRWWQRLDRCCFWWIGSCHGCGKHWALWIWIRWLQPGFWSCRLDEWHKFDRQVACFQAAEWQRLGDPGKAAANARAPWERGLFQQGLPLEAMATVWLKFLKMVLSSSLFSPGADPERAAEKLGGCWRGEHPAGRAQVEQGCNWKLFSGIFGRCGLCAWCPQTQEEESQGRMTSKLLLLFCLIHFFCLTVSHFSLSQSHVFLCLDLTVCFVSISIFVLS